MNFPINILGKVLFFFFPFIENPVDLILYVRIMFTIFIS